jgi:hypothetical protein
MKIISSVMRLKNSYQFLFIFLVLIISACTKDIFGKEDPPPAPTPTITFTIDSALNQAGTRSLPLDKNGYYHMPLNAYSNQTFSRITGRILVDGKPNPIPSPVGFSLNWESDHYWVILKGDNVATIYRTYFNTFQGKLMTVELGVLKSNVTSLVPTVNSVSIPSPSSGEVNTIFGPVYPMKGDTVTVVANLHYTIEIPVDKLFANIKYDSMQRVVKFVLE